MRMAHLTGMFLNNPKTTVENHNTYHVIHDVIHRHSNNEKLGTDLASLGRELLIHEKKLEHLGSWWTSSHFEPPIETCNSQAIFGYIMVWRGLVRPLVIQATHKLHRSKKLLFKREK